GARSGRRYTESIQNVEHGAAAALLSGRREERAERAGGAPLASDHLAEVVGRYFQLDDELVAAIVGAGVDRVGVIDERFGDELDEIFHELRVASCELRVSQPATIASSSSARISRSATTAPPSKPSSPPARDRS